MSRLARFALFVGLALPLVAATDPPAALAQAKKEKKKAKADPPPAGGEKEDLSRVLPVFDPGTHTRPISAMGFTPDKSKLVTVGQDFTVQVWNAGTGERLDVLRLPGYGREKGYDPGRWDVAAVSPDAKYVAVGGQAKFLIESAGKDYAPARLVLVDVARRKVARVQLQGNTAPVESLVFSPDGDTLAVGLGRTPGGPPQLFVVGGLADRLKKATAFTIVRTQDCHFVPIPGPGAASVLAFAPDGRKLAVGGGGAGLAVWDVPAGDAPTPTVAKQVAAAGGTLALDWSPDGTRFVRATDGGRNQAERGIELWAADGTPGQAWRLPDLARVMERFGLIYGVRFVGPSAVYFVASGFVDRKAGSGNLAGILDLTAGTARRVWAAGEGMATDPVGAVSRDGALVALTVTGNTEAVVGPPAGPLVRCGVKTPLPYRVGWANDPAAPGFAWSEEPLQRTEQTTADSLRFGFDLTKVEPTGEVRGADYLPGRWALGEWALESANAKGEAEKGSRLLRAGKVAAELPFLPRSARTLVPAGDGPPRVAFGKHVRGAAEQAFVVKADGTRLAHLLPDPTAVLDLAASPDGRYLVMATGTHRVAVYRTDGSPYPFLSFATLNGEWVCWTPEGYYAASPGGEKLFGWAVNNGPNALVTFYPAAKFAAQFRRPDVIRLAVEKGSVKEALAALKTVAPEVDKILPPVARVELVEQRGGRVKVKAQANSGAKDKPVAAMRVLLDGRPLPDGQGVWTPAPTPTAEAVFEFDVPGGAHEVKVLARGPDGPAVSDPLVVRGPKAPGSQPTVYRVCVGVNDYDDPGLKLSAATKDAGDFFKAVGTYCVGPDNRFGAAKGELLLDKAATRAGVLAALTAVRKAAKPGDLLVVFFAGHGVKQGDAFYLLTREAVSAGPLKGKAVSGDDLKAALAEVECPVLLVLDACHSSAAVKALRPATDDLTRALTDDAVGVTVLAAAMAHEVAGASAENGFFTAGLVKGLAAGAGVPFDPYEKQLYVHHLYSVAFSEVRRATGGKQNPFLNMPWTVPPLPVREVPAR